MNRLRRLGVRMHSRLKSFGGHVVGRRKSRIPSKPSPRARELQRAKKLRDAEYLKEQSIRRRQWR